MVQATVNQWSLESVFCMRVEEAQALLPDSTFSLIFCQDQLEDGSYKDLLRVLKKPSKTRLVVVAPEAEVESKYNEAIELGAFDIIASPCSRTDVQWVIIRALQEEGGRHGNRRPSGSRHGEETNGNATPQPTQSGSSNH